jgi:hypothetical protein
MEEEAIQRKLFIHLCGDFPLGKSEKLYARPVTYMSYQERFLVAGGGMSFEAEHLAINAIGMGDNSGNVNLQTGFSIMAGIVTFSYTYRFNIVSGNSLMPLSLLHQTGLAFSLYDVDKRKSIKTINFPKL